MARGRRCPRLARSARGRRACSWRHNIRRAAASCRGRLLLERRPNAGSTEPTSLGRAERVCACRGRPSARGRRPHDLGVDPLTVTAGCTAMCKERCWRPPGTGPYPQRVVVTSIGTRDPVGLRAAYIVQRRVPRGPSTRPTIQESPHGSREELEGTCARVTHVCPPSTKRLSFGECRSIPHVASRGLT
jgi:hypothetical protein